MNSWTKNVVVLDQDQSRTIAGGTSILGRVWTGLTTAGKSPVGKAALGVIGLGLTVYHLGSNPPNSHTELTCDDYPICPVEGTLKVVKMINQPHEHRGVNCCGSARDQYIPGIPR